MPGFQSFFQVNCIIFVLVELATSSMRVKDGFTNFLKRIYGIGSLNKILSQKCSDHKDTKEIVRTFLLLQE